MSLEVGNIVQLTYKWDVNGETCLSVFNAVCTIAFTTPDANTTLRQLADLAATRTFPLTDALANCISNQVDLDGVRTQILWPTRSVFVDAISAVTGGVDTLCSYTNVSAAITRRGVTAGRKNVSTLHVPGVPDGQADAGVWGADYRLLLNTLALKVIDNWVVGADPGRLKPIIYRKSSPTESQRVTSTAVQFTTRTMRRRTVGLGI